MSIFLGAAINGEHTLRDWGAAITNSDVISVPEPNLTILDIPGRNGRLDLSEALTGDVSYTDRTIKLELAAKVSIESWYQKCLHIFNKFHGRAVTVVFDDDPTHFYKGRAVVSDPQRVRSGGTFTVTVDTEPFRYEAEETVVTVTGGSGTLSNARMPVCPKITVSEDCELVVGTVTYTVLTGTHTIPAFILNEGETSFTTTAEAITFTYRQGVL